MFDAHGEEHGGLFLSDRVLAELCRTLSRSDELERAHIPRSVRALLDNCTIALEVPPAVRNALNSFGTTATDFPDCLIATRVSHAGCSHTLTFDQRMKSLPDVRFLQLKEAIKFKERKEGSQALSFDSFGQGKAPSGRRESRAPDFI